ncbi:MAG: hypothetical protein WDZ83_09725 [Rhizobiaceae bacterium]
MKNFLAAMALLCAIMPVSHARADPLELTDITTPIVPQAVLRGDREFDGNGPVIVVGVALSVERNGRAIFAAVEMSAREIGGDGSHTAIGPLRFLVWRWHPSDGARFVERINSETIATIRHTSGAGCVFGCAFIGPAEDGALIVTVRGRDGGLIRDIRLLGDTAGDDISTDNNPHGDTSIRRIRFNTVDVTFTDRLVRG